MKFQENEVVRVRKNCEEGVKCGDIGIIIAVFSKPREAYEVEFLYENGEQKAQCTLLPEEIDFA